MYNYLSNAHPYLQPYVLSFHYKPLVRKSICQRNMETRYVLNYEQEFVSNTAFALRPQDLEFNVSVYMLESIYRCYDSSKLIILSFASTSTLRIDIDALLE
jgi:hypothetical protein